MIKKKEIALVLSGINPHIELIQQLKDRGYYVILIDFAENPPAKRYADEHIKESLLDKEKVLEIAQLRKASLVISVAAERANAVSCYALEKLGLYSPYSYETAMNISEKSTMKQIMKDNHILTANFIIIDSLESIQDISLSFPIVIKPLDGYGSKGVRKTNNIDELSIAVEKALSISKSKNVLLEEYISGREMSVDCFIDEKKSHILLIREKQNIIQNHDELQSFGSISPAEVSEALFKNIQQIANQIKDAFKLRNSPLLIQIIAKGDIAFVLEFSPRLGGGLCFRTVKLHTDFDYVSSCINSFLGFKQEVTINEKEIYYSIHNIYSKRGKFSRVDGAEYLISNGVIKEIYLNKAIGVEIGNDFSSSSRVGQLLIEGKNKNDIYNKIETAFNTLEVYDTENKPILLKDFYLKKI